VHAPVSVDRTFIRVRFFDSIYRTFAPRQVLVFLDSHIEANVGWIEPLLDRIALDASVVAVPVIDVISDQTLEYEASRPVKGSFTWRMFFTWEPLSSEFVRQHGEANPYP